MGIDGHPSMVSRIANLSKLDVALVIEAPGNLNMPTICTANLGSTRRRWPPSTPPGARTSPWAAPLPNCAALVAIELPPGGHHLGVELGTRLGFQCHRPLPTIAGADEQSVGAKSNSMA